MIYDISPVISEKIAVFPGDTPFSKQMLLDMGKGDNLTLSSITATVHLGAHTDAPQHYHPEGAGIAERSLDFYLGPCCVIEPRTARGARIQIADLAPGVELAPRVLFKTDSFPDPNVWNEDFCALSPDLVHYLAEHGVKLVGIDTPSIDPASAKKLSSHEAVYSRDMAILEGIILKHVPCGKYQLIALPLRLAGCDASPVRAVLLEV